MVRKTNMIIAAIIAFAMMALTGCPEADLSNVGATVGVDSLSAPTITTSEVRENSVYLSWTPVNNASYYVISRAEKNDKGKFVKEIAVGTQYAPYNSFIDYVKLDMSSIANDKTYQYRVVAYSGKTSLDGSEAKLKVDVTGLKAKGEKVAAAENVTAEYNNGTVKISFDKADNLSAKVTYTFAVEGLPEWDGYTLFGSNTASNNGNGVYQKNTQYINDDYPIFAGAKLAYTITTSWTDGYYAANTVTGTFDVPSTDIPTPIFNYVSGTDDGIQITFNASTSVYKDATFKLYRAEIVEGSRTYSEVTSTFDKTEPNECDQYATYTTYTYLDESVDTGKSYQYVLTGTIGDKALKYQSGAIRNATYNPYSDFDNDDFESASNFQVLNHGDGTVDLSWEMLDGWTYSIERCLYYDLTLFEIHGDEETEVVKDIVTLPINNVKVYRDKPAKTEDQNYCYKYTLIGTKDGVTRKYTNDEKIVWFEKFNRAVLNVLANSDVTTDISVTLSSLYDYKTLKFYRAEVDYSGDKYITEYQDITTAVGNFDATSDAYHSNPKDDSLIYRYKDKDASKKKGKYYKYNVKVTYKGEDIDVGTRTVQIPNN